jgi:hypothetical protein
MTASLPARYSYRVIQEIARQSTRVVTVGAYQWPLLTGIFVLAVVHLMTSLNKLQTGRGLAVPRYRALA